MGNSSPSPHTERIWEYPKPPHPRSRRLASKTPHPAPEGVSKSVLEVEESFLVHDQYIPGVVVNIAFLSHMSHQFPF